MRGGDRQRGNRWLRWNDREGRHDGHREDGWVRPARPVRRRGGAAGTTGIAGTTGNAGTGGSAGTTGSAGAGAGGRGGAGASAGGRRRASGRERGSAGGSGGAGGAGGAIPLKNPPAPSAGCGKPTTVTSGKKTITSGGNAAVVHHRHSDQLRHEQAVSLLLHVTLDQQHRRGRAAAGLLLPQAAGQRGERAGHLLGASGAAGKSRGTWDTSKNTDHILFDDILAYVKANLCIDTTRVFATGFSFGGMMTYSLSVNHQKDIRAAVGIAPANYNIYVPTKTHQPIAWMQTTGMSDTTCPWVNGTSTTQGAKYIAIEHAHRQRVHGPVDHPDVDNPARSLLRLHRVHDGSAHQGLHLQRPPHQHQQRSGLDRKLDSRRSPGSSSRSSDRS